MRSVHCRSSQSNSSFSAALLASLVLLITTDARGQGPDMAQVGQEPAPQQMVQQQHPLEPALQLAYKSRDWMNANLRDYSATLVKRERIDGTWGEPEYAFIKVRSQPFSVYMYFLAPAKLKGQECMYVDGQNNGNMFAHASPGTIRGKFGTVQIAPTSAVAMQGQRYPITELGVANLTRRLIEVGEKDRQYGECDVRFFQGAKVAGRVCTMIQVVHPVPRRNFLFHIARIYVDDEWQIPLRYEAYDWPSEPGGKPVPLEEYTYMNVQLNQGFSDEDFDVHNSNYTFYKQGGGLLQRAAARN